MGRFHHPLDSIRRETLTLVIFQIFYLNLPIAGVILGGGEFVGGRVSPIGAVIGALTLTLAGSFLSFMRISPDWQIGAQGAILIIVLAMRLALHSVEKREKAR